MLNTKSFCRTLQGFTPLEYIQTLETKQKEKHSWRVKGSSIPPIRINLIPSHYFSDKNFPLQKGTVKHMNLNRRQ